MRTQVYRTPWDSRKLYKTRLGMCKDFAVAWSGNTFAGIMGSIIVADKAPVPMTALLFVIGILSMFCAWLNIWRGFYAREMHDHLTEIIMEFGSDLDRTDRNGDR